MIARVTPPRVRLQPMQAHLAGVFKHLTTTLNQRATAPECATTPGGGGLGFGSEMVVGAAADEKSPHTNKREREREREKKRKKKKGRKREKEIPSIDRQDSC